ncbi:MAG: hypothetical protein ACTSVR_07465 [Candidatus Thorarchaeota archaeon]
MEGIKGTIIKYSTELVSVVMIIVTLLCPVTVSAIGGGYYTEVGYWVDLAVIAVLWTYFPFSGNRNPMGFGVEGYGLFPLNPTVLFNTFPIWFLNIIFAAQVIRYYTADIPRRNVMLVGYLSLIPPTIAGLFGLVPVLQWTIFAYVGPIPIQFIVGYVFVRFSRKLKPGIEPDQEWIDEEKEEKSWWESQNDAEDTSQEPATVSYRSRIELIVANLKDHPIRSMMIIGLFIIYLPIVYQIHLNIVATKVSVSAGMYFWNLSGCSLGPIPFDYSWFGVVSRPAYMQLTPIDVFIYTFFYPSMFARVMWSVLWLTFGIFYIISPLLKSSNNRK